MVKVGIDVSVKTPRRRDAEVLTSGDERHDLARRPAWTGFSASSNAPSVPAAAPN
jgi:hypothetical protein